MSKREKKKRERQTRNRLLTIQNKLRVSGGDGQGHGLNKWWGLRSTFVMCTGCCTEVLNYYTVHVKLIFYCISTNWN